jgi:DNA-binding NtrC family response regulator
MRRLRSQIRRIAPYFRIALIRGERGTHKHAIAHAIHDLSAGAHGPFIARRASLLADSLNGNAGVSQRVQNATLLLEPARGGAFHLTHADDLSLDQQAGLLRLLRAVDDERSTGMRGGPAEGDAAKANPGTRILASSGRDLRTLAAMGQFRQDLCARLAAVEILVPPLRQRTEDIALLADWMLRRIAREAAREPKRLTATALARLREHTWPENLRELRQVVADAAAAAPGELIEASHLPRLSSSPDDAAPAAPRHIEPLQDVIQRHVLDVLARCGGNKLRAAELLGISRSTLYRMLDAAAASPLDLDGSARAS